MPLNQRKMRDTFEFKYILGNNYIIINKFRIQILIYNFRFLLLRYLFQVNKSRGRYALKEINNCMLTGMLTNRQSRELINCEGMLISNCYLNIVLDHPILYRIMKNK